MRYDAIAQSLGLTHASVKSHIREIYKKLDVINGCGAVWEGMRQGLVKPPEPVEPPVEYTTCD